MMASTLTLSTTSSGSPSRHLLNINGHRRSVVSVLSGKASQMSGSSLIRPDFEIVFKTKLDKRFECPICCQVLRYPVQFDCGHRCCSSCLPELLRVAPRCPIDQTKVIREKTYPDKAYAKEIDELEVKCCNHEKGCSWEGTFKDVYHHMEKCDYITVSCPNKCGVELEKRFLQKHKDKDCVRRKIECEFCSAKYRFEDEIDHLNQCAKFPVPCPSECGRKDIPRGEMNGHLEKECPKAVVPCSFSEAGCNYSGERKDMEKHIHAEPEKHLSLISGVLSSYRKTLELQTSAIEQQEDRLDRVEGKVDSLEKLYGAQLVWKIDNFEEKLAEATNGKKQTIFSPPFLTSRHGYKMALSVCLNGDGKAKGKYVSLFTCICKGEYDALLLWPFFHKITFTLIDQNENMSARKNITYTIKPTIAKENQAFLGRPIADRNASFGATKFIDVGVLESNKNYTRDDTMFIKVNVDNSEMVCL